MRAQFLNNVGLLFNFLVAFEANQGVTLNKTPKQFILKTDLHGVPQEGWQQEHFIGKV